MVSSLAGYKTNQMQKFNSLFHWYKNTQKKTNIKVASKINIKLN